MYLLYFLLVASCMECLKAYLYNNDLCNNDLISEQCKCQTDTIINT